MRKLYGVLLLLIGFLTFNTTTVQAEADNQYGIKIDGEFDDWADKKPVDISWGQYEIVHQAALLVDNENIYYYVTMSKSGKDNYPMKLADYELTVGNRTSVIYFHDGENIPANGTKAVKPIDTSHGDKYLSHSQAIVHRYVNNGVEYAKMECKIPFSDLGVAPMESQSVSMYTPILGRERITAVGGSTKPYLIVGLGLIIAILGLFKFYRHKKILLKK